MRAQTLSVWTLLLILGAVSSLHSTVPDTLNYQGRIRLNSTGAPVPDSSGNTVIFSLFTVPTGGSPIWSETWGSGSSCVTTTAGLFNVVLGSFAPLNLLFDQPYYLQVTWYNGATPETMTPRQPLTSGPYAMRAKYADSSGGVPVPLSLSGNVAFPGGVITATNTGSGNGIVGYNSLPGGNLAGPPTLTSPLPAGVKGYTAVSNSAGVAGFSDITHSSGVGVMGIGYVGMGGFGRGDIAGSQGGQFSSDAVDGKGLMANSSFGTAGVFSGVTGISATGNSPNAPAIYVRNQNPSGRSIYSDQGSAVLLGQVSYGSALLSVSQNAAGGGGGAIYGFSPASATAAVSGFSGDLNAPGPGSYTGMGLMGSGPVGVFGTSSLSYGVGVVGSVSSTSTPAIYGENRWTGDGIAASSNFGRGVNGSGVTGVAGSTNNPNGVGVEAKSSGNSSSLALHSEGSAIFDSNGGPSSVTFNTHVHFNGTVTGLSGSVPNPLYLPNNLTGTVISGTNFGPGPGLSGESGMEAVFGYSRGDFSPNHAAVYGLANSPYSYAMFGVQGDSNAANGGSAGVLGRFNSAPLPGGWNGATGVGVAALNDEPSGLGLYARAQGNYATGVFAQGAGMGLRAVATGFNSVYGIYATSNGDGLSAAGFFNDGNDGDGLYAQANNGDGVYAYSNNGDGLRGQSNGGDGVFGASVNGDGVRGQSQNSSGVYGSSTALFGNGVEGDGAYGVLGWGSTFGVYAYNYGGGTGLYAYGNPAIQAAGTIDAGGNYVTNVSWPSNPGDAANKQYVDSVSGAGTYVAKAGDTMSGTLYSYVSTGPGTPAIYGYNYASGQGLYGYSQSWDAIYGYTPSGGAGGHFISDSGDGVYGESTWGTGVEGFSSNGLAGYFDGNNFDALHAYSSGSFDSVYGENNASGIGVHGYSGGGDGVRGESYSNIGAHAVAGYNWGTTGTTLGIYGQASSSPSGIGVTGYGGHLGVRGDVPATDPTQNVGVIGTYANAGVAGSLPSGAGVAGTNDSPSGYGVYARAYSGTGLYAAGGLGLAAFLSSASTDSAAALSATTFATSSWGTGVYSSGYIGAAIDSYLVGIAVGGGQALKNYDSPYYQLTLNTPSIGILAYGNQVALSSTAGTGGAIAVAAFQPNSSATGDAIYGVAGGPSNTAAGVRGMNTQLGGVGVRAVNSASGATALDADGGLSFKNRTDTTVGTVSVTLSNTGNQGAFGTNSIFSGQIVNSPFNSVILLTVLDGVYGNNIQLSAKVTSIFPGSANIAVTAINPTSATLPGGATVQVQYMIINRHN